MRAYRNELIKLSDWTQGADVPDAIKLKWHLTDKHSEI